jgi:hypothetical protein
MGTAHKIKGSVDIYGADRVWLFHKTGLSSCWNKRPNHMHFRLQDQWIFDKKPGPVTIFPCILKSVCYTFLLKIHRLGPPGRRQKQGTNRYIFQGGAK